MFLPSCMLSSRPDLSRIGFGVGWVGWKNFLLVEQLPFWLSSNFRTQFSFPFVTSMRSLAEVEVTCISFSYKTSPSFQSNNFLNTISWKCFLKDDCIRSSLIECQSFLNSKIDVDPIYRVLMSLPCIVQVLCMTWYIQVNLIRILVTFVHRINKQKEYCLSLARILTSRYESRVDGRMKIERTSNKVNILQEIARNHNIVLQ